MAAFLALLPALAIAQTPRDAKVTVTVTRGRRVVKRFGTVERAAGRTFGFSLRANRLPRGVYIVRLLAQSGEDQAVTQLATRRL